MITWPLDAVFYHIYPLGMLGAARHNALGEPPTPRLQEIAEWVPHLRALGVNALYLGPLFESTVHGYDTADYYRVDRRLGDNASLAALVRTLHDNGIKVILDGVFHHVGRDFWAFRDLQQHGEASAYRDWFKGIDFSRRSPNGDAFAYDGWNGHYDLVKLNLDHPAVREHLFGAIRQWVDNYDIDGLRLDVASEIDRGFLAALAAFCHDLRPDFWVMGEAVNGDYREIVGAGMLDSATNYEAYKGLYSSLNDHNYHEIAHTLKREFGEGGIYQNQPLYNFVDNHDVERVASTLHDAAHLYPLYALLFTMPGVPSIYYGSEWGMEGRKGDADWMLRPRLQPGDAAHAPHPDLAAAIARLASVRHALPALRRGSYEQLAVEAELLVFRRSYDGQQVVVVLNASLEPRTVDVPSVQGTTFVDALDPAARYSVTAGRLQGVDVPPMWARVLVEG